MTLVCFCVFAFWLVKSMDFILGNLKDIPDLEIPFGNVPDKWPKVSIIFAARNEAEEISAALKSLLALDYPDYEVIAVNDRSDDNTLSLMRASGPDPRLKILNIDHLPEGWVGKSHALYEGYRVASGEYLLFTDADVRFDPRSLKASMEAVKKYQLDHLTVFPRVIAESLIEAVFTGYFLLAFQFHYRPWKARDPKSGAYFGVGAFNLIWRPIYEKIGAHREIALELVDDMMLGKKIKQAGGRQMVLNGSKFLAIRWVRGFDGVWNGLQKNAFAGLNYSLGFVAFVVFAFLFFSVLPFGLVLVTRGMDFLFIAGSLILLFINYLVAGRYHSKTALIFPLHPLMTLLIVIVVLRSAVGAWKRGGVMWRDTFYPLANLKKFRAGKGL